jgi:iron complex outermembrane recepter protein
MPRTLILLLLITVSTPALAQRTTNNAVTSADDAFGRAVGNERIGIYSPEEVRGFNPTEAGNVRIEGLYFDQQAQPSNRLIDGSTIRVGYAVRGYPFPAPTGIVDLKLEKFEGEQVVSAEFEIDQRLSTSGSIQAKIPLIGKSLGVSFGQGFRLAKVPQGRYGHFNSHAVTLTWKPAPDTELTAFWSGFKTDHGNVSPIIFPSTAATPAEIDRKHFLGQDWTKMTVRSSTFGAITKVGIGQIRLSAGLFRSSRTDDASFADLLGGTAPSGRVTNRVIFADTNNDVASTSGEIRLNRAWSDGERRHSLIVSLRGRDQVRNFGGQQRIPLGVSQSGTTDPRPQPVLRSDPNDRSSVRQFAIGLGYDLQWRNRGSFGLFVQKADYKKDTRFANALLANAVSTDRPWLLSGSAAVTLTPRLVVYGGFVRGLEESAVAPDSAINRGEAPPALRTTQKDFGLRYTIKPGLNLITGAFDLRKSYYSVDTVSQFRKIGTIRNRGLEVSLAGALAPGITLIAGGLLLDPTLSGRDISSGNIGKRPVGSFKHRIIANLDWKPLGQQAWSFDAAFEAVGATTANIANSFAAPPRETLALGSRYRFKVRDTKILIRAQITNITDAYGWKVSSSGGFTYTPPRSFTLNVAADF